MNIYVQNISSALTVITWAYVMGSHVNYSVKGKDVSIPFRGFSFSTPSAPSRNGHRGLRRG